MNTIEQVLRGQTEGLKVMFVEKVKAYAEKELASAIEIWGRSTKDWCDYFGIEPVLKDGDMRFRDWQIEHGHTVSEELPYRFPDDFYKTEKIPAPLPGYSKRTKTVYVNQNYITYEKQRASTSDAWQKRDKWVQIAITKAERHYDASIKKVVDRLLQKGFTDDNMLVFSASLSAVTGFEMLLKNQEIGKYVRCWTIIAEGPVQRPHYRFLVKASK